MHHLSTSFVLGYHGCDLSLGERLLAGDDLLQKSENAYDWLGPWMYFWEANPLRALEFAHEKRNGKHGIHKPFVIGAVVDLGLCLDLITKDSVEDLKAAHESLLATMQADGGQAQANGPASWMRYLDCAVIRRLHEIIEYSDSSAIDTVRGIFQEGSPIDRGSAFLARTHIQIAVVNPNCVKAVFRVQEPGMN